uniref:Pheromone binding protein n=1 Tax=Semiothisa cinerearia TaxID=2249628 RepID=A0A889XL23_9NEOP|nr:pheromone binding protein [Semiothisa cinerearia]
MEWKHVLVVVVLVTVRRAEGGDAMKLLATGFVKVLEECKKELNLDDNLISDLYHYWKLDFSLLQRETGCAIICMSKKLELLGEDGKLHHGNAKEYAMRNGAGDELATKMISIIHGCEDKGEGIEDDCARVLEVAKCFRVGLHDLHWEPKVDVIITEVLTEI